MSCSVEKETKTFKIFIILIDTFQSDIKKFIEICKTPFNKPEWENIKKSEALTKYKNDKNALTRIIYKNEFFIIKLFEHEYYDKLAVLLNENLLPKNIGIYYAMYLNQIKKINIEINYAQHPEMKIIEAWEYACFFNYDNIQMGQLFFNRIRAIKFRTLFITRCITFNKLYMIEHTHMKLLGGIEYHKHMNEINRYIINSLIVLLKNKEIDTISKINMYKEIQKYWKFDEEKFKDTFIINYMKRKKYVLWKHSVNNMKKTGIHKFNGRIDIGRIIEKIE
jgi:hypothetical protein